MVPGWNIPGSNAGVSIDNDTQPGIIPLYMVTDHWGLELLAATPFEHDVKVKGASIDAGSVTHLPPTLSMQWCPYGGQSGWQPFVGLGLNYPVINGGVGRMSEPSVPAVRGCRAGRG